MSKRMRLLCLLPLLAACSVTGAGLIPNFHIDITNDAAAPAAAAAPSNAGPSNAGPSTPLREQGPEELAIWRSASFRRQFVESYSAESEIEPKLTTPERDLMQKVYDLMTAEKPAEALKALQSASGDSVSAVIDFTIGNIHFQQERLEEAATAYNTAVAKFPKFRRAWRNLALVLVRQAEYVPAIDAFTRVLGLGGVDSTTYGLLGFSYSNIDAHLSAETAYRMAVLMDSQLLDWQLGLARSLFKQERFAEAAALCTPLVRRDPDRGDFWMLQANAYLGLGNAEKAAENLEMVDRLGQSTAESLNTLGDIYVNDELFDLAVGAYLRAIDAGQPTPDRAMRACRVLIRRGALSETHSLVDAIQLSYGPKLDDKQKKDLLHLRSSLAMAEGAGEEEAKVLAEIVALDPLDGGALIQLGQYNQRTGNVEQAAFYYERAANIPEYEADAKQAHGQLLVTERKYREALPLLKRAQALKPRDALSQRIEQVERLAGGR
ncbi:MAG: tetratricopeptide repeat protein [Planctomycetes bacterium]|nr:tetratricopeptide repeat protein [Planctomycetota bacterium]MCB9886680.1 tetratricopeptide repeat protein [Planctomycetota bacterium]